jgi:DNA-binding MarR family transcriptional regulator
MRVHHNYMQMHLLQAQVRWPAMAKLDEDALDAWRAFLTAHAHVTRAISRDLADAGLPDLSWYDLLWALYRRPDRRLRVNELAREVVLSPTAMSRFVDRVEAAGYVRRDADPADRRALQVTITPEGVDLLRRMWPVYEAGIERHFAAFLGKSAPRVRAMLQRMADSAR